MEIVVTAYRENGDRIGHNQTIRIESDRSFKGLVDKIRNVFGLARDALVVSVNKNGSKEDVSFDDGDLDFQAGDFVAFTFDDRGFGSAGAPVPAPAAAAGGGGGAGTMGAGGSREARADSGHSDFGTDPEKLSRRIVSLTEKLHEESGVAQTIRGQSCIFVMATTGTGKSTCINYMLGNPICQKEIQLGDGNIQTVITLTTTTELSHVALIGHRNLEAGTTTIQTFPMETEGTNFEGQDIFIVDSCGFHDPEGEDVDIKNAVSLRHAMRQCGSLRPVFLLNAAVVVIDRANGLLAMLQLFARFFNPVENFMDHFQFFFTHCSDGMGWKDIKAAIFSCLNSNRMKESECLSRIANLIYDHLSKFKEKMILKAEDLTSLGSRRRFLNQVHAVRPIEWEDLQQISLPLSNDVIRELRNMCSASLQQIQTAISMKPIADVHTAVALVTSLDTLHTSVDVDFVKHRFDEAKTILLDHLNGCVRRTNGTVRNDPGLIEAARMALENDNFNDLAMHMENLRNARCAKRYKDDIVLIYKDMVRKLNSKVSELTQEVLQRPDTDPEDALKLNDLSTITKSCHTFLVGDTETAYRRAIESIEERAQSRELLCSDGLTVLETVLLGDVHSAKRSDVYVLEVEEREIQCTLFMDLFDSLQKLKALQGFKGHVQEHWLNSYSIFKDRFTNCMVTIHGELFDEGQLLVRMESCKASDEDFFRLKHLHSIVKSCMSSKFDDIAFDDKGAEALDHLGARLNIRWAEFLGDIVKEVTKIMNNHGDQVAVVVSRGKSLEDMYHFLRLMHSIDLMEPEFRQFKREKVQRAHTVVKEKVMSLFESGQLAVTRLEECDLAQGNNIAETCCLISDVFQTLNRASCLSPLVDGLLQVNGDDDSETSSMLCLLKSGLTRDWKTRLSSFRSLVVPNSDVQSSLGFDHDDDESENCSMISTTASTTNDGKLLQQRFARLDQMQPLSSVLDEINRDSFQLRIDIDARLATIFENSDLGQFNDVDTVRYQFEVLNSWVSFVLSMTERKSLIFHIFGDLESHWTSMKLTLQNTKGTLMARIIETSTIANQQSRKLLATALKMSKTSEQLDNMEQICLELKAHLDVQRNNSKLIECVKGLERPALLYKEIIGYMEAEISRFYREWQQPLIGSPENCDVASIRVVKEFFQQAVVFKDHFPNMLDISQMATTLDLDYRNVINRTHDEVVKLLQDSGHDNFSRIANLLQPYAEPAQGSWGRQEKAVFESCKTALVSFSRRFVRDCELIQKGLSRQIQTTQQVIECIDDLRDKLSFGRRAMHIQRLVTSGPIEMVNAVETTCNMLFDKLQEKFERELNKFGFVQASDVYRCICELDMLSLDFDIFREQGGEDPSFLSGEVYFKEGDVRCQSILLRDRSSKLKLTHVDNLATNIESVCHHYLGLCGDSSNDGAFALTPPFARMWLGNMCTAALTTTTNDVNLREKARSTIEPVKIHKMKQLFKAITSAVTHMESDGNLLFEGEINFEEVKLVIENLLIESASAVLKQATMATGAALATQTGENRIEIEKRCAEYADNALTSAKLVYNVVREFNLSIDDEDPFEKIKSLREAIRIRQTSVMIGIDEDTFDFCLDQIVKIRNFISCLDRESPQKVYFVKRKLAEKMKTKGHHFGLDREQPPTMASEHIVDLIDFVTALNQFEDSVQFNDDDDSSRKNLKKFNKNFISHTGDFYITLEGRLKEGQRLFDLKADINVFETALTDHVGLMTNEKVKEHCESLIAHVGTLLASVDTQIEGMRTAQTMVAQYDLFAVEDMETIVKNLIVLANQSNTKPTFGSMEVCGFDFDSTRAVLMKQLEGAKAKVEECMAQCNFDTINIGLNNILKLKGFGPMASLCDQQANMIVMKVRHRQKLLCDDFVAMFDQHSYSELDPIIAKASSFDKSTSSVQDDGVQVFEPVMETIHTAFRKLLDDLLRRSPARNEEEYAFVIFEMKSIVKQISSVSIQTMVDQRIEQYIGVLTAKRADFYKLGGFLIRLGPAGEEVTERYAQFKAVKTKRLNALFKTKGITLGTALNEMERGSVNPSRTIPPLAKRNIAMLRKAHELYESTFKGYILVFLEGSGDPKSLVRTIQQKAAERNKSFDSIVEVMAGIFAVRAVQTSKDMFHDQQKDGDCVVKPNVVQLLGLFRLLELDVENGFWRSAWNDAKNACVGAVNAVTDAITGSKSLDISKPLDIAGHLIEVGTGEGKSILLGALSCFLALTGFEVHCACYSKYLSNRDFESFRELFDIFEITNSIHYSTMAGLAEMVINRNGNVRDLAGSKIFRNIPPSSATGIGTTTRPQILLIDEVDVFFSDNFLGNTYNPSGQFLSDETRDIMTHIWENRASHLQLSSIQALPAYKQLLTHCYPEAVPLIDQQVQLMLLDVKRFDNPPYEIVDKENGQKLLGYKVLDAVNTTTKYRYKTAFAYLYESRRHAGLTHQAFNELYLQYPCGSFSYSEIPQTEFKTIMGVTGTLCSSAAEDDIVKRDFKIEKLTSMPSIYGPSNRTFNSNDNTGVVLLDDRERYYQNIFEDICNTRQEGRPVLVFFESEIKMTNFLKSDYGRQLSDFNTVTESTENVAFFVNRATEVDRSTGHGAVTLFPKVFGRGLDFVVRDERVDASRGVHVLQTFYSDTPSEEVQIMGRTARQAKKGSYKVILLSEDLIKDFGLTMEDLALHYNTAGFFNEFLRSKREAIVVTSIQTLREKAVVAKKKHDESVQFSKSLCDSTDRATIISMMMTFVGDAVKPTHIVFCLDESGSMRSDWTALVNAFSHFLQLRADAGMIQDVISVIQFGSSARKTMTRMPLVEAMRNQDLLKHRGGGTLFEPALNEAVGLLSANSPGTDAIVLFMTDGESSDRGGAEIAARLHREYTQGALMFFGVAFRNGISSATFKEMINGVPNGRALSATNILDLRDQFQHAAQEATAQQMDK